MKKKILYYNWIQFDNPTRRGGGVNIYQYNLIEKLINKDNYDLYFLSGGLSYNPIYRNPYIQKTKNKFKSKVKTFELINSPIWAPSLHTYTSLHRFNTETKTYEILKKFIIQNGPFDIIHFNNIEGISFNVLKIKEDFPNTKIVYSIHNYQAICPLVQYFQNHNECICNNFNEGKECLQCAKYIPVPKEYVNRCDKYLTDIIPSRITKIFRKQILKISESNANKAYKYIRERKYVKAEDFVEYRKHNIELINKYVDNVLAVSNRVRDIMLMHGVRPEIIQTSYIGTKVAETAQTPKKKTYTSNLFTIAYLGYANVDKGFFFMLDSLTRLPLEISKKIHLVLAGKGFKPEVISKIKEQFNDITIYDNYSHDDLPKILDNVDLGIIPVIWEDNLPQVAIEMVASGTPILCSSFGGASELCRDEAFKFEGGNREDFIRKLTTFVEQPELLNDFWKSNKKLVTMDEHFKELEEIYK